MDSRFCCQIVVQKPASNTCCLLQFLHHRQDLRKAACVLKRCDEVPIKAAGCGTVRGIEELPDARAAANGAVVPRVGWLPAGRRLPGPGPCALCPGPGWAGLAWAGLGLAGPGGAGLGWPAIALAGGTRSAAPPWYPLPSRGRGRGARGQGSGLRGGARAAAAVKLLAEII